MALITHTIPSLMNGVSQQPTSIRLSNQCEEQINATCRVADGLSKRLAVEMISANRYLDGMTNIALNDATLKMHMIRGRNPSGDITTVQLLVDCVTGTVGYRYMEAPFTTGVVAKFPYLTNSLKADIKFLTDGDTTYILNKAVIVGQIGSFGDSPETAMRRQGALACVKNGYFGTTYDVTYQVIRLSDNVVLASNPASVFFTTNSSSATTAIAELQTTVIANAAVVTPTYLGLGKQIEDQVANVANVYINTHLEVVRADNWFQLKFKPASGEAVTARIEMKITSSTAEAAAHAFNGIVNDPLKLPKTGPQDYTVKVDADPTAIGDQYYLAYDKEANGWLESKQLGLSTTIDSTTLPIVVSGFIEGSITSSQLTIKEREVGDLETSPDPSFVNHELNDMFIFNNRLGFLSKNNVIMSRIDEFDVFYRTSCATSLSADRVDVKAAVPSSRYTDLNHGVTFETALLLFGDAAQYILNTNTGFDLTKTSLQSSTEYEASQTCSPINVGSSVYFPVTRGGFSGIFDLSRKDGLGLTAEEATYHISTYIQGTVNEMTYSSVENIFFARTVENPRTIYVQNRFIRQTVLEQNAWHKWVLPNDIVYINVLGDKLYICMVADDGITLIRTSVDISTLRVVQDPTSLVMDFKPHLDYLKLLPTGSVLSVNSLASPYFIATENASLLVGMFADGSQVFGLADINTALQDSDMWVGIPFTFSYTFSEQVPAQYDGGSKTVYQYGRLTLRSMKVSYFNTGKFDVIITPTGRDPFITKFTGTILGSLSAILGKINVNSGIFKFPVNCRSNEVRITIESSYPFPATFNTAEYQATFTNNAGRM